MKRFMLIFFTGVLLSGCGGEEVAEPAEVEVEPLLTDEEVETLYEEETMSVGKIEVPLEDVASDREPMLSMDELSDIIQGLVDNETYQLPQDLYDTFMAGYDVTTTDPHVYVFMNTDAGGEYLTVTFDGFEQSIVKVEHQKAE